MLSGTKVISMERSSIMKRMYTALCFVLSSALDHSICGVSQGSPRKRHDRRPHPALMSLSADGWKWQKAWVITDSNRLVLTAQTRSAERTGTVKMSWKGVCSRIVFIDHAGKELGWWGLPSQVQLFRMIYSVSDKYYNYCLYYNSISVI